MLSSRVNGSCHGVETVRIRGADHRAEIVIAYREGVSHGVVKRKVGASVITHGEDGIIGIAREAGTGEVSPPPHPGRSAAAISVAAVAAPILSNSRRVTFLDSMGSFLPLLSLRCTGEADRPEQLPMSGLDVRPTGGTCPPRFMSGRARLTRTLGRRDDHRREDQLPPCDWHGRDRR